MSDDRYVMDDLERLYRRACGTLDALSGYYKRSLVVAALRGFEKHGADPKHPAGIIHSALWHLREEVARLREQTPTAPAMLAFAEAAREWFAKAKDPAFNGKDNDAGHRERWDRMTKAYDTIKEPPPPAPVERCEYCGATDPADRRLYGNINDRYPCVGDFHKPAPVERCHKCHTTVGYDSFGCRYCGAQPPNHNAPAPGRGEGNTKEADRG